MIGPFRGKYTFLSNFYPSPVEFEGLVYPTVENAYVAAKTLDVEERKRIAKMSPSDAKKHGKKIVLRKDWDDVKLEIMTDLLYKKFEDDVLADKLADTGEEEIVEVNWWGDTFWGKCNGVGENHLGKILMDIRAEINNCEDFLEQK